jgi:riboflavin kinase/FMN adenylyltransferase
MWGGYFAGYSTVARIWCKQGRKYYLCADFMAVYTDLKDVAGMQRAVVTIGTFDGVHKGHCAILAEVAAHAHRVNGESVLLTFEPHPRKVLFPDQPLGIITPLQDKLDLIVATGIHHVVVVPFTHAFAAMSAAQYLEEVLVQPFTPHSIVIGYDHRFGHDRAGNIDLLKQYAPQYGYSVTEIPAQQIHEAAVSSTRIRRAIAAGHIAEANEMLGRFYAVNGEVVHGQKLGRTIGYPTANLLPSEPDQVMPGNGIYAVYVWVDGIRYKGMMSIGYNPTVTNDRTVKPEVNILDFDKDIYGNTIRIEFVQWLRAEEKFEGLDALKAQLGRDREAALAVL